MPLIPLSGLGDVGIIKDLTPESVGSVPLGAWTDGKNVSFIDGAVMKGPGRSVEFTPDIEPYGVFHVSGPDTAYVVCTGLAKIYAYILAGASGDITRAAGGDYVGGQDDRWQYADFNGVPIFNNGKDIPQAWTTVGVGSKLVDLANWPSGMTAKALRGYKSHLVALNVFKGGVSYPRMVKWSHAADPGVVPNSWNEADPTKDAGETFLVPGDDALVDGLALGGAFVIYGENSMWSMHYVGGMFIFGFNELSKAAGLVGPDALCEINRRHFVVTLDDVVLTDGESIQSIASPRVRKWLFSNLSQSARSGSSEVIPHA
jgi:hypothetical protein